MGIRSIAFPCIGTGDANFSKQAACSIAVRSVRGWMSDAKNMKYKAFMDKVKIKKWHQNIEQELQTDVKFIDPEETVLDRISNVIFCCFDEENWALYQEMVPKIFTCSKIKYSFLWKERQKSIQHQHEIHQMLLHIQNLQIVCR